MLSNHKYWDEKGIRGKMKEKVLLVTKCGKNYGATLQAYALSQSIKKAVFIISFKLLEQESV